MAHGNDSFEIQCSKFFSIWLLPTKDGKSISAITGQNLWDIVTVSFEMQCDNIFV